LEEQDSKVRQERQQLPVKRAIKQLPGTYSITEVKYHKREKLEKSIFSTLFLKTFKDVKFTVDECIDYLSTQIRYSRNSKEQNCVDSTERLKKHLQLP